MFFLRCVFIVLMGLCVSYGAVADDSDEILVSGDAIDNAESEIVFEDVEDLTNLVKQLGWEKSNNQERRDLYQRLINLVGEIDSVRKASLQELQQEKIVEAQDAYDQARENERSTENKLLGATSMAAMGIGGMELASAMSEKNVMEDAEMQMKAYLATFACDWADGKRVAGGETSIELPGGNELMELLTEYKTLATDLKARKEVLGLKPGVESEEILDKANSGLYDDVATGTTDGAFTSLARALSDETSEDAAEWSADKAEIEEKVKKAGTAVAVAAVASVVANLAVNGNANRRAIAEKAETARDDVYAVLDDIIENCNRALEENGNLTQMIIGYNNLHKIKGYSECNN